MRKNTLEKVILEKQVEEVNFKLFLEEGHLSKQ